MLRYSDHALAVLAEMCTFWKMCTFVHTGMCTFTAVFGQGSFDGCWGQLGAESLIILFGI